MELNLAIHPDWPLLMSNTPASPDPAPQPQRPILPATERHNRGKAHLAHVINYWLAKSDLRSRYLTLIIDWALDECNWLHNSKLSQVRRNAYARALPMRYIDALGAANNAIWLWQCKGPDAAMAKLGPPSKNKVERRWLNRAIWLPHPEYPTEPLSPADWFDMAAGYLELPCVAAPVLSPGEGPQLTEELCRLLFSLVASEPYSDQIRHLMRLYSVADRERRDQLRSVLTGISAYESDEIERELYVMAEIVAGLRGLSIADYGPAELYAELTRDRRQHGGNSGDR